MWYHTCWCSLLRLPQLQPAVSYRTYGGNVLSEYIAPLCKQNLTSFESNILHAFPFFIIAISEAVHIQINCRHTIGMSTCPHCNEVQPCNLYIKCSLCPFIAWRELKASWCFALRRRLVFWWGAVELLVAILNPSWQRQDGKGGAQLSKNQVCKQFSSTRTVLTERVCPLSQINNGKATEGSFFLLMLSIM